MAAFAPRYARALLDLLEANGADVEAAGRELADFADAWRQSDALRQVFIDPSIPAVKKIAVLDRLNARLGMSQPVRNFLAVILQHDRAEFFEQIHAEFERMLRGDMGIARVEWTTARPLDEETRRQVEQKLAAMTGRRIEATFHEDAALLGGARLQVDSMVYDGSVRGRLDGLREKLAGR